jgi:hypothetical protein
MTTVAIKKELNKAINDISDPDFLSALQTIVNNKRDEEEIRELSTLQKKNLDNRKKRHKNGLSKSYTLTEVRKSLFKK